VEVTNNKTANVTVKIFEAILKEIMKRNYIQRSPFATTTTTTTTTTNKRRRRRRRNYISPLF
jgi:hypothetical protein